MKSLGLLTIVGVLAFCSVSCDWNSNSSSRLRGRSGGFDEVKASSNAFAEIREDWDMLRIPFWYPVDIVGMNRTWELCDDGIVVVYDVKEVGSRTNLVYGRCTGLFFGKSEGPQGWFVLKQGQKEVSFYTNEIAWQSALRQFGVTNYALQNPLDAWKSHWSVPKTPKK